MSGSPAEHRLIRSISGVLVELDLNKGLLILEHEGDFHVYLLGEGIAVFDGPDKADLTHLQPADKLRITYEVNERGPVVLAIQVLSANA